MTATRSPEDLSTMGAVSPPAPLAGTVPRRSAYRPPYEPPGSVSLSKLMAAAWTLRYRLVAAALLGGAVGGGASLLMPDEFQGHASFTTSGAPGLRSMSMNLGALGGLAGQLGALSGLDLSNGFNSRFFATLVTADAVLEPLVLTPFPTKAGGAATPLYVLLKVSGRSHADSIERAIKKLRHLVVSDLDSRSGVIDITFGASSPLLVKALGDSLLAKLDGFVGANLRGQAGAQRHFLEERVAALLAEVHEAQAALLAFDVQNHEYPNSPVLRLRDQQLRRDVDLKQEVYLTVARSLEEARMNEVRDLPVISVIDRPRQPALRSSPKPRRNAIALAALSALGLLAWATLRGQRPAGGRA